MPRRKDGCRKADKALWYSMGLGYRSKCEECPFPPEECPRGIRGWQWRREGRIYSFQVYQIYFGEGGENLSKTAQKLGVSRGTVKRYLEDWFIYPERDPYYLAQRNQQVREQAIKGKSVEELSRDFCRSRRTIQRILAKDSPPRRPGRPKK